MKDAKHKTAPPCPSSTVLDDCRQLCFPLEFRIAAPEWAFGRAGTVEVQAEADSAPDTERTPAAKRHAVASNKLVAELATCLWYLKTKHFKCAWDDPETGHDDPRVRRALSRLSRSIDAMRENGIEVHDPTNQRYPPGGEGMMRPIQFVPTAGLTFDRVSETVAPIVYRDDRLIQRGEVFVSVPKEEQAARSGTPPPTTPSEQATDSTEADSVASDGNAEPSPPVPEDGATSTATDQAALADSDGLDEGHGPTLAKGSEAEDAADPPEAAPASEAGRNATEPDSQPEANGEDH